VLPAGSAEPIYVHSGTAKGVAGSGPIRKAAGDAIAPLEEYLGRGGSSN